jgi:UDPglucose--hexose-1-phosphate uridylyltransferase
MLPHDPEKWGVRVIANQFPALSTGERAIKQLVDGRFTAVSGLGSHEVVIETPDHSRELPDRSLAEVTQLFEAYQLRYLTLCERKEIVAVAIFKNRGHTAGASLAHPHSQIIASPVEPPLLGKRFDIAEAYYRDQGNNLYATLRDWEREGSRRMLFEDDGFVAFQPFASRWPFETWIMPLVAQASFGDAGAAELTGVAKAVQRTLSMLRAALGEFDYNLCIQTAPLGIEPQAYFLWHIQILPRLIVPGGLEFGSGMWVNSAFPEETATFLREAEGDGAQKSKTPED